MSVNSLIIKTLSPFGYPVEPDLYTGTERRYFTFNYADERGRNFGDNEPGCIISYMQIHFFLPVSENYLKIKNQIREALFKAGFTYPSISMLLVTESKIRHIIFECQIAEEREE